MTNLTRASAPASSITPLSASASIPQVVAHFPIFAVCCSILRALAAARGPSDTAVPPALLRPLLTLPESLLSVVSDYAELSSMLQISRTCRSGYSHLWDNTLFWHALLQARGFPASTVPDPGGPAFRAVARRAFSGIDRLVQLATDGQTPMTLKEALRAVSAIQLQDGTALIQKATVALASLLKKPISARGGPQASREEAEAVLEVVACKSDLFTTEQMLTLLGAHQKAEEEDSFLALPSGGACSRAGAARGGPGLVRTSMCRVPGVVH